MFEFMGGSMGSVVGEKITRQLERALAASPARDPVLGVGRRAHAGGRAVADADGEDVGGAEQAARGARAVHRGALASDDRRRRGVGRDARRSDHRRARRADRVRRTARDRADDPPAAAARASSARSSCSSTAWSTWSCRARISSRRSSARCAGSSAAPIRRARTGKVGDVVELELAATTRLTTVVRRAARAARRRRGASAFGSASSGCARCCAELGEPERSATVDPRRRHERQGLDRRDDRCARARRRQARRDVHVAAPVDAARARR